LVFLRVCSIREAKIPLAPPVLGSYIARSF
jgi:hypothetical protein